MFIDRGFTVKESKECGAGGSMVRLIWKLHLGIVSGNSFQLKNIDRSKIMKRISYNNAKALLTMASPEEALRALAVMHNYAPEEYKVSQCLWKFCWQSIIVKFFPVQKCCRPLRFLQLSPKAAIKTPKYCTRHFARGFSHMNYYIWAHPSPF